MCVVDKVREFLKKINISGRILTDEPMSRHTTFRTGGPADIYAEPADAGETALLLGEARRLDIPVFILGGGANILIADRGIRGLVVGTAGLRKIRIEGNILTAGAGLPVSDAAEYAADAGLGGLDFIYAMPGSTGGALWMNARCYDASVSDVLESVRFLDEDLRVRESHARDAGFIAEFAYKKSPFQGRNRVILDASFRLRPEPRDELRKKMDAIRADRAAKGHFLAPCAGSVFKNNRDFGAPSGVIIDRLGFRGMTIGGAQVSPLHANIIVNSGGASAADIRSLIETIRDRVEAEFGFLLEPEILFAGDWNSAPNTPE